MKTIEAYQASDGRIFENRFMCVDYEGTIDTKAALAKHITTNCPVTFSDDAGFYIIENTDVAAYILANFDEIEKMYKNCST